MKEVTENAIVREKTVEIINGESHVVTRLLLMEVVATSVIPEGYNFPASVEIYLRGIDTPWVAGFPDLKEARAFDSFLWAMRTA